MIIQKVEANASRHQKKRYTGPILSEHGKVTDLTKGSGGSSADGNNCKQNPQGEVAPDNPNC